MATLTIRNVDEKIHAFLRKQAARHGRSMEAEVRDILKTTMRNKQARPGDVARRIHAIFAKRGGADDLVVPERDDTSPEPVALEE